MTILSSQDKILAMTPEALLVISPRIGVEGAAMQFGMLGALIMLAARGIAARRDRKLQSERAIHPAELLEITDCRVVDLPDDIRRDPQWPKVRDGAKVQVVPKRCVSQIKVSAWKGTEVTTFDDKKVVLSVMPWQVGKLRRTLAELGYVKEL